MKKETIKIPDIGGADSVEVIEICVAVGDQVAVEDSLIVLESDKASLEVPSPFAGKVAELLIAVGDNVAEGDRILVLEVEDAGAGTDTDTDTDTGESEEADVPAEPEKPAQAASAAEEPEAAPAPAKSVGGGETLEVEVPDIGTDEEVEVIEICVAEGDDVAEGDSLIVLESDKASMEVPSPSGGKVHKLKLKEGDRVHQGSLILELLRTASEAPESAEQVAAEASPEPVSSQATTVEPQPAPEPATPPAASTATMEDVESSDVVYAGPAVRKLAREFGLKLVDVRGTGPRGRVVKEDLQRHVKNLVDRRGAVATEGSGIPPVPAVDFAQFGEVDEQPLTKLHKLTAANMHRSWLNVPHVTQFDDADITELEAFRKDLKSEAEARGVKLTPMPFLLKACAAALRGNPKFNASLHSDGEQMVYKQYVHIGIAVDTPAGLVVPVIRDVDRKSVWELAAEILELAQKARDRKLKPDDMQGGCFTISSLGNIGGSGFTPIINAPEVAILGVSRLSVKPVWNGSEFVPRQMLPLSLSYDHRAVNGADAGRFLTGLGELLTDIRRLVL